MERDRTGSTSSRRATRGAARSAARRSVRRNRVLGLAILSILALAALAPAGHASGDQAQRALSRAEHAAEREAQRAAKRAARIEAKAHNQAQRIAQRQARREAIAKRLAEGKFDPHAAVAITCTSITVEFHGFTPVAGSPQTVFQKVIYRQSPSPTLAYVFAPPPFEFAGAGATETIPIAAPLGDSIVAIRAHFSKNEQRGSFNIHERLTCGPNSQFSLQTLQALGGGFTSATLPGAVGETVDYQTTAVNTGNTPLVFSALSDPGCDGAPAGGGAGAVPPRGTVVWYCHHTLTAADQKAGPFANAASVTATPELDPRGPFLQTSQGVLVNPIVGEVSTSAKAVGGSGGTGPKAGVLGFNSTAIPSLLGPARCVRGMFSASVKSTGVSNVTFYIDGHKLARRTAHSAVKGLIAVRINGAKLRSGVHRLLARISMSNHVNGSRTRTVRRCSPPAHKH